jgi:RNA polymerase sigma-70 factor, ECF subfamily
VPRFYRRIRPLCHRGLGIRAGLVLNHESIQTLEAHREPKTSARSAANQASPIGWCGSIEAYTGSKSQRRNMRPKLVRATELLQHKTPEALEEAIGLLQNTIYSFSMKMCGHPEDAEDTTQEVLFRSLGHLAKIQDPRALAVWLYTVTRNRCWRMRRKPAGAPARTLSLNELMPDDLELGRLIQDAAKNPEGALLHTERHDLLHQAVLRIPAPLRIVLILHDMEELATEQVAQVLNLQPGTVRVRLHRARLSVHKEMSAILNPTAPLSDPALPIFKDLPDGRFKYRKRPAECRELFAGLSEYLDGRAEPETCDQIRHHMDSCRACIQFLRSLRDAIDRCRALEVPCNPIVASRIRSLLTTEYLRMLGIPIPEKLTAMV